jgi:WD40 repeat protein/serine/threonine protein kinase
MNASASSVSRPQETNAVLVEIVEEATNKIHAGEPVDVEAYAREHPELAEQLRRLLPALDVLAKLGQSSVAGDAALTSSVPGPPGELGELGDFRIVREIGRGGMGVVYEAVQISLSRRVALKVLPFAGALDPKQLQRFKNEAQAAAHLHHTNIVPVFYVGCERGVHFYAMQYIEGQPLSQVIHELRGLMGREAVACTLPSEKRSEGETQATREVATTPHRAGTTLPSTHGPAFFRTVAQLGVQAAQALEHAHDQGVIHRDIKPANLLVDVRGHLWVTDFGLAHCQSQAGLTMSGDLVGTLRYMSPEQALAKRSSVDHRTDIYSLGVTLYELLTLQPAYNGKDREEVLRQIAFEEPRPPSRWNQAMPAELETIVLKAMAKSPVERYATAQEFADDLQRFLEDKPIRARRPTVVQRLKKWTRRHLPVVWTAGISFVTMLLLAVVGLTASTYLIMQEKAQTDAANEKLERTVYYQRIALAEREWAANNFRWADQLLAECPQHLRGWEWDYVMGLRRGNPPPFRGHTGQVGSVDFHPDGRRLVSAGDDGKIRVWEANTGKELFIRDGCLAPDDPGAAFSPDGRYFAGLAAGKRIKVWDATTGAEVCAFSGHTRNPAHLAFSPDSRFIASCSDDQTIRIWEVGTSRPARVLQGGTNHLSKLAFSPDGEILASADSNLVRLWDTATGEVIRMLSGHTGEVKTVVFSPDGTRLASSSGAPMVYRGVGGEVKVWDAKTGREIHTLRGHVGLVEALAFSADGRRLASAGYDQMVKIWDLSTGQEALTLRGHPDRIYGLAFSPNGRWLASASADQTVRLWDATPLEQKPTQELRTLARQQGRVTSVTYSPDGRCLASTGLDGTVQIWDLTGDRIIRMLKGHTDWVNRVVFSRDGKLLASASLDRTVKVWDAQTGQELHTFRGHHSVVQDVAFGPDERLASVCWEMTLKIWDARTGTVFVTRERAHDQMIHSLTFSPDGRLLATACHDRSVKIWDARTGENLHTFTGNGGRVTSVAFSPDGQFLASAGMEGIVRILETSTWTEVRTLRGHTGWIWCVRFSPDGRRLASVGNDAVVHLWDVKTGQEIRTLHGHTNWVECVAFRPDGKQIATASWDETVKIWDATIEEDLLPARP